MKLSPLQLKHYYYNHLQLESINSEQAFEQMQESPYWVPIANKIQLSITVGEPESSEPEAEYVFVISAEFSYDEKDFPYKFRAALEGVFVCEKLQEPVANFQQRLVVNATSMLYSAVREQLLTLSTRQKHGPLMLPTLDFRVLQRASADKNA